MVWVLLCSFARYIFESVVNAAAAFTAAVLSNPAVQDAAADAIVAGMNKFLLQPDLDRKAMIVADNMAKYQEDYARTAGKDFPKIVGKFIQGMITQKRERDEQLALAEKENRSIASSVDEPAGDSPRESIGTREKTSTSDEAQMKNSISSVLDKALDVPLLKSSPGKKIV